MVVGINNVKEKNSANFFIRLKRNCIQVMALIRAFADIVAFHKNPSLKVI